MNEKKQEEEEEEKNIFEDRIKTASGSTKKGRKEK